MRPTNPTTEAFRLFESCVTLDDVLDARSALFSDVDTAIDVYGEGSTAHAHAAAPLNAFHLVMARHDLTPEP